MSISGLVNAIISRIIIELVSPGQYTGIWLIGQAYTGIWLFAGRIHWNLVIRQRYKKRWFPFKISISRLGNGIRWRTILELQNPVEYTWTMLFALANTRIRFFAHDDYFKIWLFAQAHTGIWLFARANTRMWLFDRACAGIWLFAQANTLESRCSPQVKKGFFL